jgi:hypothetical protein
MNFGCFFGHKYKHISTHVTSIFMNAEDELPMGYETTFLLQCGKCKKFITQKVEGNFPPRDADDDDDGGQHDPPPILSPDDFYESLNK